jgi:hypothetical protein
LFKKNNIAVVPLWRQKDDVGVLVTTPDRAEAVIKAAKAIQKLIDKAPGASVDQKKTVMNEAVKAFKSMDYEKSYAVATGSADKK